MSNHKPGGNWSKTRALELAERTDTTDGCFINRQGRERLGIVSSAEYESLRDELIQHLNVLPDPTGQSIQTRFFKPQDLYAECWNIPPDLIIYFGNLYWWSVGSVGLNRIHIYENEVLGQTRPTMHTKEFSL